MASVWLEDNLGLERVLLVFWVVLFFRLFIVGYMCSIMRFFFFMSFIFVFRWNYGFFLEVL